MSARKRVSSARGSTIIEVMMALTMLAIGASGLIAMQKVTTVANRDARNMQIATEVARTWVERLRADSVVWNSVVPSDLNETVWLKAAGTPGAANWYRPENSTLNIHGVHDALGKDDPSINRNGPFCVNLRLTRLATQGTLIRAEIRVYWLRGGIQMSGSPQLAAIPSPICSDQPPSIDGTTHVFHAVHVITGVAMNGSP